MRAEVDNIKLTNGVALQDTASSYAANFVRVRRWVDGRLSDDKGNADYTVAEGDPNIAIFQTPFTAQRTIALPWDDNVFNGLHYELVFDGAINGTNTAVIKSNNRTIKTVSTDKTQIKLVYRRAPWPEDGWTVVSQTSWT